MWELASLVGKEGKLHVIYCDDYVVLFFLVFSDSAFSFCFCCVWHQRRFGGAHALVLEHHMYLLCFLRLWKKIVDIFYVDEGPIEVVSFPYGLEPIAFGQETGCAVEVVYVWIDDGELVHVVDCLSWRGSILHEYCEVFQHCRCLRDLIHVFEGVLVVGAV